MNNEMGIYLRMKRINKGSNPEADCHVVEYRIVDETSDERDGGLACRP
jgi:hypothetical protein